MKTLGMYLGLFGWAALHAQNVPLQRPDERAETMRQSAEIYDVLGPVARNAGKSTVWVWADRRQVALGTVIGDGTKVLTKWSEIAFARTPIQVVGGDGRTATATVLGIYKEEDLAMLQLEGAVFSPVAWSDPEPLELGRFLVAASPDDIPIGVGVVAVKERGLGDEAPAFLGIKRDPAYRGAGVKVIELVDEGGAGAAGILPGDIIVGGAGREIGDFGALAGFMRLQKVGEKVAIEILRNGRKMEFQVELKSNPYQQVPEGRLNMMRSMGTKLSVIDKGFPVVVQTDMHLNPNHCGGPVVDLDGNVMGISISRTDRTRSFIIPAGAIVDLLSQEPAEPELAGGDDAVARELSAAGTPPQGRAVPIDPGMAERLRDRLVEMQAFLQRMDFEMRGINE